MKIEWGKLKFLNSKDEGYLQVRGCPVCTHSQYESIFSIHNFQFFVDKKDEATQIDFQVVQCRKCSALYTNPAYTPKGFKKLFKLAGLSYGFHNTKRMEMIIEDLKINHCLRRSYTVLDVGCGKGDLLGKMPKYVHCVGIDIDRNSIFAAREKYSETIQFICGDLNNIPDAISPDTITMVHVLEHLPNPKKVLCNLKRVSKPTTTLVVEVPILEHSFTNDINGFFSVQHLTHFSENSLKNLLSQCGWKMYRNQMQEGYNGYRVYAKSENINHNLELHSQDKNKTYAYLENWYKNLAILNKRLDKLLSKQKTKKKIVVWGAGLHTEFLYHFTEIFREFRGYLFCLIDSDPLKVEHKWRGIPIYSSSDLAKINWNKCLLVLSSYGSQPKMLNIAKKSRVPKNNIVQLYDKISVY